jgi:GAF domain-containing protein
MALTTAPVDAPPQNLPPRPSDISSPPRFPSWPVAVLAVPIVLRAAIFAIALVVEPWTSNPNRIIPAWAQIVQATFFASLACVLLGYGRADPRAWSLGLFILDAGATLLTPFVRGITDAPAVVRLGLDLRTDAFQAALVWFFASVFPKPAERARLAKVFYAGVLASFGVGIVLVTADAYARFLPQTGVSSGVWSSLAQALQRQSPGQSDWYFTLQFVALLPLLVAMSVKLRESGPNDRRRFKWLALGIVAGFFPLATNVLLLTLSPRYAAISSQPPYLRLKGIVILVALTFVPLAAAYAALVQRTLDLRFVVRTALQYVLARSFIRTIAATPFVILVCVVIWNRDRPVADLLSGPLGITLGALTAAGFAAATGRRRLMAVLDSRFFRKEVDARVTLIAVADAVRGAQSLDEFRDTLVRALDDAFHPVTLATAVAGGDDHLHALDADLPPLARGSALAQLLAGSDMPLDVDAQASSILDRLTVRDRDWLRIPRSSIVVPLRGATESLLGVVALGEKRSELPYTEEDRKLLAAVGTASGLALDRILTAERDAQQKTPAALADPAARECVECGAVLSPEAINCGCGGLLQRASAPLVLSDRLRFLQRIGAGGMGVVYRAVDLRLQQPRAVKTLPGTDPTMMSRLRREARTMAAAKHVHLATLHGLETWRGAPMLVMEFLEGGTLADRLRRGPLPLDETLAMGLALAQALGVLHLTGILHRDIKPSNIGFTSDGLPKLLDFGLAKLVAPAVIPSNVAVGGDDSTWSASLSTDAQSIRGTPAYLSPWVLSGAPPSPGDDLWSLAITLLEACTGNNPFRAPTVAATVARVLMDVHRVADTAAALPIVARQLFADLLGSHDRRPDTAHEFASRLKQCTVQGGFHADSKEG